MHTLLLLHCHPPVGALQEAARSNAVLHGLITDAVGPLGRDLIHLVTSRDEISDLLALDDVIDLVIPRGGNALVSHIQANTRIPVLGHADGICHVYVDAAADLEKAARIVTDAKVDYPAACNAVEKVLLHRQLLGSGGLARIRQALQEAGVQVKGLWPALLAWMRLRHEHAGSAEGCLRRSTAAALTHALRPRCAAHGCCQVHAGEALQQAAPDAQLPAAPAARHEYSSLDVTLEVVDDLGAAIDHIHEHGSSHTDVIVTEDGAAADAFLRGVDSACVFHNASSRFADGFRCARWTGWLPGCLWACEHVANSCVQLVWAA